uniref:Uncharacterized protein n=1 Tax=Glossina austeni TaxID=7395 RepID=A0A1A9VNT1_GLOAU
MEYSSTLLITTDTLRQRPHNVYQIVISATSAAVIYLSAAEILHTRYSPKNLIAPMRAYPEKNSFLNNQEIYVTIINRIVNRSDQILPAADKSVDELQYLQNHENGKKSRSLIAGLGASVARYSSDSNMWYANFRLISALLCLIAILNRKLGYELHVAGEKVERLAFVLVFTVCMQSWAHEKGDVTMHSVAVPQEAQRKKEEGSSKNKRIMVAFVLATLCMCSEVDMLRALEYLSLNYTWFSSYFSSLLLFGYYLANKVFHAKLVSTKRSRAMKEEVNSRSALSDEIVVENCFIN